MDAKNKTGDGKQANRFIGKFAEAQQLRFLICSDIRVHWRPFAI
jgi:hypothetical protein